MMETLLRRVLDKGRMPMGVFVKSPEPCEYLYFDKDSDYEYNWIKRIERVDEPSFDHELCTVRDLKLGKVKVGHILSHRKCSFRGGAHYIIMHIGHVPSDANYKQTELAHVRMFSAPDCVMAHAISPESNPIAKPGD